MKKSLIFLLFSCWGAFAFAQQDTIVSKKVELQTFLFEEYTAPKCGYCPDGHKKMDAVADLPKFKNRIVSLNVQYGSLAVPMAGEADYRTKAGNALYRAYEVWADTAISDKIATPVAMINRRLFNTGSMCIFINRGVWQTAIIKDTAKAQPVNIAVQTTINKQTRELTAKVQVYYTDNVNSSFNFVNLALVQDSILGYQEKAHLLYPEMEITVDGTLRYRHNHMLRDYITPIWGDTITSPVATTFWEKEYTYTLPDTISTVPVNLDMMRVIAYVTDQDKPLLPGVMSTVSGQYKKPVLAAAADREYHPVPDTIGSAVAGINQDLQAKVSIYPNPAKNRTNILFNAFKGEVLQITVLNSLGSEVLRLPNKTKNPQTIELNTQSLPTGVYVLRIETSSGIITKKLVVK